MGVDAHDQPGVRELAPLRLGDEVAAVEQGRAVAQAVVLPRVMLAEDHKGVVLVAGGPPDAAHPLDPGAQGRTVQIPFPDVAAVKGDEVQVRPGEVQAQAHGLMELHGPAPPVGQPGGPGDEIVLLAHAVEELHLHAGAGVPEDHPQRLPALAVEGGQALQRVLPRANLVVRVPEIQQEAAVALLHLRPAEPVVPHAAGGVLLGQGVQGVDPVRPGAAGVGGEAPVRVLEEVAQIPVPQPGAVVEVEEDAAAVRLHLVGGASGVQGKCPAPLIVNNHRVITLSSRNV